MTRLARRLVRILPVAALGLVLTACSNDEPQNFLYPAGKPAREIDQLQKPVFGIAIFVFFLVQGLIVYSVIRFRRRPDDEEFPEQVHGNTRLEIGWTIIPALVLLAVGRLHHPRHLQDLRQPPKGSLEVNVTGQKYWWAFSYPEQPDQGVDKSVTTANELHIPAGCRSRSSCARPT